MKDTTTFSGTFFEVKQKFAAWKAANPNSRITREGAPVASGEKAVMLDEPVWALTIEYELPPSPTHRYAIVLNAPVMASFQTPVQLLPVLR